MLSNAINKINGSFGTHRGAVRYLLGEILRLFGFYRKYSRITPGKVRRVVFVCQGNICRSPFAHHVAAELISTIPVASIGLSTSKGLAAFETAMDVAKDFSIDLSRHSATDAKDFQVLDGDLFLVMEDRHIKKLQPFIEGREVQVGLLGLWCRPRFALLYDPHRLSREYFHACFTRIKQAIINLNGELT